VSCVSDSVLIPTQLAADGPVAVTFRGKSARAKLRRGLWFSVAMQVEARPDDEVAEGWRTHTLHYDYSAFGGETGSEERFAYHFEPASGVSEPHLHVNAEASWARKGLRKKHLVTGRVSLEDVVQMLIDDFGVPPRKANWRASLKRSRRLFAQRRSW
jgi:hypothetical protein